MIYISSIYEFAFIKVKNLTELRPNDGSYMTDLKNISNAELISRIEKLVRTERKITHLVLTHIIEIEERKIFAELGYDSMYSYLTQGLGYSEGSAYRRLRSAQVLKKAPEITVKLEDGSLNLSQLAQVQKCIRESQNAGKLVSQKETLVILEKLENKNSYETEKVLAVEFDRPVQTHESIKPQQDDSVRLQITLTQEQFKELEQAKSLLSHICHEGNWADVIATLAKNYNDRKLKGRTNTPHLLTSESHDAIQRGHSRMVSPSSKQEQPLTSENNQSNETRQTSTQRFAATPVKKSRKYISVHIKRDLLKKANNCCEYINPKTNQRCNSKYKLQSDHIQPWSKGGSNNPDNLRVLCQTHNLNR